MSLQSVTSCKSKASDAQRMACTCILSVISVSPTTAFPSNMLTSSDREGNSQPEMSTSHTKSDSVRLPLGNTANCEPRLLKTTENVVLYASTFSCSATTIRRTSRSTLISTKESSLAAARQSVALVFLKLEVDNTKSQKRHGTVAQDSSPPTQTPGSRLHAGKP